MTGASYPFTIDVPVEIVLPRAADAAAGGPATAGSTVTPRERATACAPGTSEPGVPAALDGVGSPCAADGSVVVALHGMGQSAASFAKDVAPLLPPGTTAILPQGPYPYEIRGSGGIRQGNAWYVYTGESEGFLASMAKTEAWLLALVAAEIARLGLDARRVALLGFSQGGYLAGFVGVRNPARFRALVVAGGRIKDEVLADAARAAGDLSVLHVHGEQDDSVRPGPSRASVEHLASWGVPAEYRAYPCAHAVLRDPACRDDVRAWLAARLT